MERSHRHQHLVFDLDEQRYAIKLSAVEKVIRAVQITNLAEAPEFLLGLINLQGNIIPVIDIRRALHLPDRELELSDRIIIAKISGRVIAFAVDNVDDIVEPTSDEIHNARSIYPGMEDYIEGVGKLRDNTVLLYDINKLLSMSDIEELNILPGELDKGTGR